VVWNKQGLCRFCGSVVGCGTVAFTLAVNVSGAISYDFYNCIQTMCTKNPESMGENPALSVRATKRKGTPQRPLLPMQGPGTGATVGQRT
jgi:hypothetical protein